MVNEIKVRKRDGSLEPLDLNKLHKVVTWACDGLTGVSASEVELNAHLSFSDGMKTSDIQETLIKAAAELIGEDTPNYQFVAGRLVSYHLRKTVFGDYTVPRLFDHVTKYVEKGFYDQLLTDAYTEAEWDELDRHVKHDRDNSLTYGAMELWRGKYLVRNRATGEIFETPQIAYMLISAFLFHRYGENRMKYVKAYYDAISEHYISLPTPIMSGVRTPQRQFASCVLIESDDSLDSIVATSGAIVKYVSQKAGIGIGGGKLRPIGSPVRNGDATTTGVIPYYRLWQSSTKSASQGGVRGGSSTLYCPIWHMEIEDILVLKNNRGTDENRLREMDYGIQFNKLMYERLLSGGDITLFSSKDVPGLYESFFDDQDKFRELYEKAERNTKIRKKKLPAIELFGNFLQERKDTGRIYLMNVDNVNAQGSFLPDIAPVRMSNLCTEINLPTRPLNDLNDENGEIATCVLSATNWGLIKDKHDFKWICDLTVRALDELISIQSYPLRAAEIATLARRSLGVGIINFAYWLAKNDLTYQDITPEGLALIDEYAEAWSYYLIKASADLAVEKGPCDWYQDTKYSKAWLPCDAYKKAVDELVPYQSRMPWADLKMQLLHSGIRNSTLMALMPAETSAILSNSTNGIEPPRALVSVKQSKDGVVKQVVPEIRKLKNKYDLLWDQKSPTGYLKIMAVLQKHVDQGISVNTTYNPAFYPDNEIPMSVLMQDMLTFYKYGGKQLYYFNTADGAGELDIDQKQAHNSEMSINQDDCESCKL